MRSINHNEKYSCLKVTYGLSVSILLLFQNQIPYEPITIFRIFFIPYEFKDENSVGLGTTSLRILEGGHENQGFLDIFTFFLANRLQTAFLKTTTCKFCWQYQRFWASPNKIWVVIGKVVFEISRLKNRSWSKIGPETCVKIRVCLFID